MLTRRVMLGATAAWLASGAGRAEAQQTPWAPWKDLLNLLPDEKALNAQRTLRGRPKVDFEVQKIEDADGPHVNFDLYTVDITRMPTKGPTTTKALFAYIRKNLNSLFDHSASTVGGYTADDSSDWTASDIAPLGSLMQFNIPAKLLGIPVEEQAAVVTSLTSDTAWTFTPVTIGIALPGEHPVSGNRQFGIRPASGLAAQVFTRAADRPIDNNAHIPPSEKMVFDGADKLWRSFQAMVVAYVKANGGDASPGNPVMHRPSWNEVKASGLFQR